MELSEKLVIPVLVSCPTTVNIPHGHPHFVETSFGMGRNDWLRNADVILIIDSDIPYIPMHNKPRADAQIFHVDVDVLKDNIGLFHVDAIMRCRADAELALTQIVDHIPSDSDSLEERVFSRRASLREHHDRRISTLNAAESVRRSDGSFTVPNVIGALRRGIPDPEHTLILNESISNYPLVWEHLRPDYVGNVFSSGSSSLGWGLGAAIGASLARCAPSSANPVDLIVLVVGDGSYLFGVPASAFWIARRYNTVSLSSHFG